MTTTQSITGPVAGTGDGRRLGLALLLITTAQLMVVLDCTTPGFQRWLTCASRECELCYSLARN